MARRDGDLVPGITAYADGPEEMRKVIDHHVKIGVDVIKLSMSGEEITEIRSAQDCYFTDEETAACVDEAHKNGKMLCAHARARDSVKMCIRHGVDAIYHASYIDEEGWYRPSPSVSSFPALEHSTHSLLLSNDRDGYAGCSKNKTYRRSRH